MKVKTSFAMAGDRKKTFEAGYIGYIEKPIDPETFPKEVGQYLTKSVSQRSAE